MQLRLWLCHMEYVFSGATTPLAVQAMKKSWFMNVTTVDCSDGGKI